MSVSSGNWTTRRAIFVWLQIERALCTGFDFEITRMYSDQIALHL